jgi:phosphoglycerate dehydrogenase-like enzyme
MKILINGAAHISEIPGLEDAEINAELLFAADELQLGKLLPDAEILLGWNFRGRELESYWSQARKLQWIHWCGAGVDAVLFDGLANSEVTLTNSRGIFDLAMAEYVLGYILSETKQFPASAAAQAERRWDYKISPRLAGQTAVIFGVGSIGRAVAALLKAAGLRVIGVGRSKRGGDGVFECIESQSSSGEVIKQADWIIGVLPSTGDTMDFFDSEIFQSMKPTARFINIGRGTAVDESALIESLAHHRIAGAMLDVFKQEPLPEDSPIWTTENLVVSPHISGDYNEYPSDIVALFLDNLECYMEGNPLKNIVDKKLGFVRTDSF